jgi:hypothetical protein
MSLLFARFVFTCLRSHNSGQTREYRTKDVWLGTCGFSVEGGGGGGWKGEGKLDGWMDGWRGIEGCERGGEVCVSMEFGRGVVWVDYF